MPDSVASLIEPPLSSLPAAATPRVAVGIAAEFETATPSLQRMLAELEIAAAHDVSILLIGETGTGKTYLARLIHELSPRRAAPLVTVACGALPPDLIESELFGHVRGAFTSAHADKDGKFIAAGAGTILLDEIDVLHPEQQVKLLRVIETGEFEPVGCNRTLCTQARLVVASNLDLQPLVEQGRFRADLYYRLSMLCFDVPPLRDRGPDILPLARKFIRRHSAKHGITIARVEQDFFEVLQRYPWPGNVRELENVVQRAVIYCRSGILSPQQLPAYILDGAALRREESGAELQTGARPLGRMIARTERDIIDEALRRNNHSRTRTAKELGISRVTLYNKLKKYGFARA